MKLLKYMDFTLLLEQSTMKKVTASQFLNAAKRGNVEVIKRYIDQGGDLEIIVNNENKHTALLEASGFGKFEVVQLLLSAGANIEARDSFSNTSLILASSYGRLEAVKVLVQFGANVKAEDKYGRTPLFWANFKHYDEIKSILEDPRGYLVKKQLEPTMNKVQKNSGIF